MKTQTDILPKTDLSKIHCVFKINFKRKLKAFQKTASCHEFRKNESKSKSYFIVEQKFFVSFIRLTVAIKSKK